MTATTDAPPFTLPVRPAAIPAELKERPQWVGWKWEQRGDKWTKVPVNARTGRNAATNDPATWTDFETAHTYAATRTNIAGIGFVFAEDDPYAGVDFDHCRDPETGVLDEWAKAILTGLDTWADISPSGGGIKAIARGVLPGHGMRRKRPDGIPGGAVEMYDRGRFFALTGHHLTGTPVAIHDAKEAFEHLYQRLTAETRTSAIPPVGGGVVDAPQSRNGIRDAEVIQFASRSKNGAKFTALWMGDAGGYVSQSEADIALCSLLAFYTGADEARIDRLFRRSGLMRDKWDERRGAQTYGQLTTAKAIAGRTQYWTPGEKYEAYRSEHDAGRERPPMAWTPPADTWPAPLGEEAYHGIVGDIVRAISPHTEADEAALLVQLLVAAGNCIGRTPHFMAEADYHALNFYAVLVGDSSKGRKGTSWGHIRRIFERVDAAWVPRIMDGLSSGEGLIHEVRDPQKGVKRDEETIVDPGSPDKRLLVQAPEFASVLQVQGRDGSTLSGVLRTAWDRGNLRVMTRKNPLTATGAHISIIGHVTRDELLRLFDSTDAANGYANRFLWFAVRRSKLLPLGGRIGEVDFAPLIARLSKAVYAARMIGEITRDEAATTLWCQVYGDLSEGKPGLIGAMTARAEAQVMRLACLYAVLDLSRVIRVEHLLAALAVWAYSAESARWIFGDRLGDPVADEILRVLRMIPDGLTRTEISDLFGRNKNATQLTAALHALEARGMARCEREAPQGGMGRHIERWYAAGT